MKNYFLKILLLIILIMISVPALFAESQHGDKPALKKEPTQSELALLQTRLLALCPLSNGFDYPVGRPSAKGYYNAQAFGDNYHLGDDWNAKTGGNTDLGDPVYAISNGVVFIAEDFKRGWGNVVRIYHNTGTDSKPKYIESLYAHLDEMIVESGTIVSKGDQIGTIGNVNGRYLAHLHFEMRDDLTLPLGKGYSKNSRGYIDPTLFIQSHRSAN